MQCCQCHKHNKTKRTIFHSTTYNANKINTKIWVNPNEKQLATPENPTPYKPNPIAAMTGAACIHVQYAIVGRVSRWMKEEDVSVVATSQNNNKLVETERESDRKEEENTCARTYVPIVTGDT